RARCPSAPRTFQRETLSVRFAIRTATPGALGQRSPTLAADSCSFVFIGGFHEMFYYLSQQLLEWSAGTPWAERLSALRLFKYITFRSAGAAVTALLLSWYLGPRVIHWLKQLKFGQDYKDKAEVAGEGIATRILSK